MKKQPRFEIIKRDSFTYDIVLTYESFDEEFGLDFLSKKGVKFLASGIIIATIHLTSAKAIWAASQKYSMSYLYTGTPSQQITYVNSTKDSLNTVSPSYFDLNPDGSLKLNTISRELVSSMHSMDIKVVPFLSNHWNRQTGINALNNIENLSSQIANAIEQYNLDGVNIDIENVSEAYRTQYIQLTAALRRKIPSHKEVSVAVAANPNGWNSGWHGSYDYKSLAANSDYLMVMTYDEHYEGGSAGPVASYDFVENSIKYALSKTTKDKIVLGLPFFGRIWSEDGEVAGKGLDLTIVDKMIRDYSARITFDEKYKSPKAEFTIKPGDKTYTVGGKTLSPGKYVIWYENEKSLEVKLSLIQKYDLKGAGSWALGKEPANLWDKYSIWLNGADIPTEKPTPLPTPTPPPKPTQKPTEAPSISAPSPTAKPESSKSPSGMEDNETGYFPDNTTEPSPTIKPTEEKKPEEIGTVIPPFVEFHPDEPNISRSNIITLLTQGMQLLILSVPIAGWYKVKLSNGKTGYVKSKYIKKG